jgi:uncharacterized repeat protein (TIGR03803 family)
MDGATPYGGLVQATDGNFYGTTYQGGALGNCGGLYGCGTVFKITPGGTLTTLYSFCSQSNCTDGNFPSAGVVQGSDGSLYGTASGGGANSTYCPNTCGTIFKITLAGALTTLHSFDNVTDGYHPSAALVQATDGNFYGTTPSGGINGGGAVFKITAAGAFTTLYNFCLQAGCTDGHSPLAGLVQASDGNFYGTTVSGGALEQGGYPSTSGTVFKITPGGMLTTLYSFCSPSCSGEAQPRTGLMQGTDGNLYGTIFGAGSYGLVYEITTSGSLTILHRFKGSDGGNPGAGLIQGTNGKFYGTTTSGGANGLGTVFSLDDALSVAIAGSGTVTSADGFINCGTVCISDYSFGASVVLSGAGAPGSRLLRWTGCDSLNGATCVVAINGIRGVTALFGKVAGDFNGDLMSDVLWRNLSTGENGMWLMNGSSIASYAQLYQISDLNWQIAGTGDFDGDGKCDILWRNSSTGQMGVWFMNGLSFSTVNPPQMVPYVVTDLTWQVVAVADFDGDGKADILWRNSVTGDNAIWLMNGANFNVAEAIFSIPDLNWKVAGTGDFDGDGKADIFWRNTSTGENGIWLMNGFSIARYASIYQIADQNWQVAGIGDFDGDGLSDILWFNSSTGYVGLWTMNGFNISNAQIVGILDPNYRAVRSSDFDGDGKADVIWRNRVTGANLIWLMNGFSIKSQQSIYTVSDLNWRMY